MPKSTFLDDSFMNHVLRGVAYPTPAAVYLALYTTSPTPAGGGVEVSGGSYSRQATTWSVPASGVSNNTADVVFAVASADWGVVTSFGLMDALVGGNLLYFANLNAPRNVQTNDQVSFPTGQLVVTES